MEEMSCASLTEFMRSSLVATGLDPSSRGQMRAFKEGVACAYTIMEALANDFKDGHAPTPREAVNTTIHVMDHIIATAQDA